ncbi:MAG TPA: hypothetical protein VFN35_06535 [Ktedonobacteraceae bacterium]|nr:hypothetical protein [Ktedonobacteraceae bacterium]
MNIDRYLLGLYPHTWRMRYEAEIIAMLEQRSLTLRDRLDLLCGALDAHLHPELGSLVLSLSERTILMIRTMRNSLLTLFCAYAGFCLAGLAFQKVTEYDDFMNAAHTHSLVGFSFNLVVIGSVIACLAVMAGGLPIAYAVLRSAINQKRFASLFLLFAPILVCGVFLGVLFLLKSLLPLDGTGTSGWQIVLNRGLFVGTLLLVIVASAGSWCLAVIRNEVSEKLLHFALFPALLTAVSMLLMLVATIIWGLGLRASSPQLFSGNDGIMGSSTAGSWLGIIIAMTIAIIFAFLSLFRGFSARSHPVFPVPTV